MKRSLFLIITLVGFFNAQSQNDLTLSFMENIFQSTYINPASIPVYKVSVGLPVISSVGTQFTNTGFSYGDLIQKDDRYTNDTLRGNIGNAYKKLDSQNYTYAGAETDLFHIRIKVRRFYFSAFSQVKFKARYSYPLNFMDLVVNGNGAGQFGQVRDFEFKNLGLDVDLYRTIGIGVTKEWKHWIIGTNLKYIGGIANVTFDPGKSSGIKFNEQDYFAVQSQSDMVVRTSGLDENFGMSQLQNADGSTNQSAVRDYWNITKNPGAAIDAAVTYRPSDKWQYTVSIINFGFINWKSDVVNRKITGGKDFKGFDVFGYFLRGESKPDAEAEKEFKNSFSYSTSNESYRRWMIPQLYLTAKYNITYKTHIGLMGYFEYYKKWRPAVTASIYHKFGRVLNVVGTYSVQYGRYDNIGLGVMAKAGPCQFYFGGDNLVAPLVRMMTDGFEIGKKTVDPIKTFNVRVGMNLVFGAINESNKQTYEFNK